MIRLLVVGGFLGAGKTTLINRLLARAERRFAVLVNDFGSVAVDAALLAAADASSMTLANGCVCCSIGDDFGLALERVAAGGPELVVVEASGVSDPWRIAQLALVEPGYELGPLVVLADAADLPRLLADPAIGDVVRGQLAYADIVVLTKTDLAGERLVQTREVVRTIRPQAHVIEARHGEVGLAELDFAVPHERARFLATAAHPFRTWTWRDPRPFDRGALRALLGALPASVLRIKGFCGLDEEAGDFLLQYAAERWSFTRSGAGAERALVVIGTQALDPAYLAADFAAALR
ncbi:MAG: GTP-binding protein [Rhodospirillales bacterium]|nr:GTP-binding protein [Rhodospirillales bacterium]